MTIGECRSVLDQLGEVEVAASSGWGAPGRRRMDARHLSLICTCCSAVERQSLPILRALYPRLGCQRGAPRRQCFLNPPFAKLAVFHRRVKAATSATGTVISS